MSMSTLLTLILLLPVLATALISVCGRKPNLREAVSVISAAILFTLVWMAYQAPADTTLLVAATPISGLQIAFSVTRFGLLFALIASGLWVVSGIYAMGYMRAHHEKNQTRFFALFAAAIGGVMAIAFADNLFTLFLFYELLTVSTYPLVTHAGTPAAKAGGKRYLVILMGSSIAFLLPAMVVTWLNANTLTFRDGGILAGQLDPLLVWPLLLLFMLGISKAGLMPLHRWLPSAMVAPTPVSALLHAVAVVKAGVFTLLKVVLFIFGPELIADAPAAEWLLLLPMLTILLASLVAMTRDNLKERLAYSTVSQLSYIVLGALMVNVSGMVGATMHIAMHAFAKITLFFAAGAILVAAHKTRVSELNGLGRSMPWTFGFFTIGALSIIGMPLFGGMWSKWYLVEGAAAFSQPVLHWALLITLMLSTLLNIWYLLSIPMHAFFKAGTVSQPVVKEAPVACLIGMAVPAALCIYLFFDPHIVYQLAIEVVTGGAP